MTPITPEEAIKIAKWAEERIALEKLDARQFAMALLHNAPMFGHLADLCEEAANRICPGILDELEEDEDA